jgi:hypothetical protein
MSAKNKEAIPDEVDENENPIMTKKYLRQLCYQLELYETPSLNEKLYLHYKRILLSELNLIC